MFFFNKRNNCGNFSLEYYVKSSITSEYSLIPFSCEFRQCAFVKEGSLIQTLFESDRLLDHLRYLLLLTEHVTDNAQVNRAQIY